MGEIIPGQKLLVKKTLLVGRWMSGEAGDVERSKVRKFLTTSSQQLVPHNILPCLLHRHNGPHSKSPLTRSISRPCPPGLDHLLTKQTKHLKSPSPFSQSYLSKFLAFYLTLNAH